MITLLERILPFRARLAQQSAAPGRGPGPSPGSPPPAQRVAAASTGAPAALAKDEVSAAQVEQNVILVVDDDKLMRNILTEILHNCGYSVVSATNGSEALDKLQSTRVRLIITDLIMPEMSGLELIRHSKQLDPELDVIVITASNSVDIAVETMRAGAADYIVKPFHLEQIRIVVARALEMRRLREQARKAEFYKSLAERDGLTGLLNHRTFQELLRQELQRASRYERQLSLLMIDVDKFKPFNDTWGHPAGDRALRRIAQLLDETCRDPDHRCRYGGEEFAVIVPETDKAGALRLAERVRRSVEKSTFDETPSLEPLRLTISIGVATYPADATTAQGLVERADEALYAAKEAGRNRVITYRPGLHKMPPAVGDSGRHTH